MKKKVGLIAACALAATLAVGAMAGCSSSTQQQAPATNEPASYEPLSVAYLNKAGYEDIIVGDKQGYFNEAGPEVTLYTVSGSGQQSVEAMLAGSADLAATGQGPVADAIKQYGDDIVVVATSNVSTGGQVWVAGPHMTGEAQIVAYDAAADNKAAVKESFEKAASSLGGTVRLGVQQGATTESEVKAWLKAFDISFNDFGAEGDGTVSLVDVKANTLPTTLASGTDIDMMAASQPYPDTALSQIEGAYKVGSNADIDSYGAACLITTKEIYEQKEDSIKAFVKALQQSCDFMNQNTDEAITICAESMGADQETVKAAFDVANFKMDIDDLAVQTIYKTCQKKGVDITEEQLLSQMPLKDWLNGGMTD